MLIRHGALVVRSGRNPHELWMVELAGELDLNGVGVLNAELQRVEAADDLRQIIIDLSELDFIGCSGMQVLYEAQERSRSDSNRLSFRRAKGQVEKVLVMTEVDSVLNFAE